MDTSKLYELFPARDLLIIDFEATCWGPDEPAPTPPPEWTYSGEIIEFGVVHFSPRTRVVLREYQSFVRPRFHPLLTGFCTELTSITQGDVDGAPPFADVLADFIATFQLKGDDTDPVFCSMGNYDRLVLQDDCRKHGAGYPFADGNHLNIKDVCRDVWGIRKKGGRALLNQLGFQWQGTQHRGIDDARNYAVIMDAAFDCLGIGPSALRMMPPMDTPKRAPRSRNRRTKYER